MALYPFKYLQFESNVQVYRITTTKINGGRVNSRELLTAKLVFQLHYSELIKEVHQLAAETYRALTRERPKPKSPHLIN